MERLCKDDQGIITAWRHCPLRVRKKYNPILECGSTAARGAEVEGDYSTGS